jgi:hypothetical protein
MGYKGDVMGGDGVVWDGKQYWYQYKALAVGLIDTSFYDTQSLPQLEKSYTVSTFCTAVRCTLEYSCFIARMGLA